MQFKHPVWEFWCCLFTTSERQTLVRARTGYQGYLWTAPGQKKKGKGCVRKVTGRYHASPSTVLPLMGGAFIHHEDEGCSVEGHGRPGLAKHQPHTDNKSVGGFPASIQLEEQVSCIPAKIRQLDRQVQQHHHPSVHSLLPPSPPPSPITRGEPPSRQPTTQTGKQG